MYFDSHLLVNPALLIYFDVRFVFLSSSSLYTLLFVWWCKVNPIYSICKLFILFFSGRVLFFLDQFIHVAILYWVSKDWSIHFEVQPYLTEQNLLLILAVILLTSVTSIVLKVIFSIWDKDLEKIKTFIHAIIWQNSRIPAT